MELILKKDVKNLGRENEVVRAAAGYARNFLIPKGFAVEAVPSNLKILENEKERSSTQLDRRLHLSQRLAQKIEGISLTISKTAGEEEKLFGSVTKEDIVSGLLEKGIEIDKKLIDLEQPIKKLGIYGVKIRLHPEVEAKIKVWVIKGE